MPHCPKWSHLAIATVLVATSGVQAQWEPERRLTRNDASSETSINFARNIAADDSGRVHIAWVDERDGNREIYYKRSIDGGLSWGPPIRLTVNTNESNNPSIAVDGDDVHVAWWDTRSGVPQIWHKRSLDGGLTWESDSQVTSGGNGAHCSIAVRGPNVHLVYVDGREGQAEVFYTRSLDQGENWEASRRISEVPHNSYTPTIAVYETNIYVAWTDTRHGGFPESHEEEYFRRSTDNGVTWDDEVRLTFDPENDPENSWAPSLAADDQYVWIAWFDFRDGNWEIYTKRSRNFGESWSSDRRLTIDEGASQRPSIAKRGDSIYIVWWDTRDFNNEIYWLSSPDLGVTWGSAQRITQNSGTSVLVTVAAAESGVHISWQDDSEGNNELYYSRIPGTPAPVGNGLIAFNRMVAGTPQLFTVEPDGSDARQVTFEGVNSFPGWSRDGSRLVYTSTRSGSSELWVMAPDGSGQTQVTFTGEGGTFVADWSYDGTRLAFASVREGVGHPEVWTMNIDGSGEMRLTEIATNPNGPTWSLHPTWSPDDDKIYYASTSSGSTQIWGMFASGLGKEQKTNGVALDAPDANVPEWSRDGSKIVFWAGFETRYGEVWTMTPAGSERTELTVTTDPMSSDNPSWSPDSAKILSIRTEVELQWRFG